jgi:hypothetical protein
MEPYQQRVIDEKTELDAKLEKLSAFIGDANRFNGLHGDERVRLTRQESVMTEYSRILGERIAFFEGGATQG